MAKGRVLGFPGLDVPGPDELRPSPNDSCPERGALEYVPPGIRTVHDYGAEKMTYGELYGTYDRPTSSATLSATPPVTPKPSPAKPAR
jgi:hypothetical protein